MNLDILTILRNVIDICLVWLVLYYVLKNIRNNVKMTLLFKGLIILLIIKKEKVNLLISGKMLIVK